MKLKILVLLLFIHQLSNASTIGLCIMATGKYLPYAEQLIESARNYFFTQDNVMYYVFTDGTLTKPAQDIHTIYQAKLGWPKDTLMRSHIYLQAQDMMQECDYLFALDADMLFVDFVGREILSARVATQHPGYMHKRAPYEFRSKSTAFIDNSEKKTYFAGGFYGGKRDVFIHMLEIMNRRIMQDLNKDFIAVWHDESHLNRFLIDFPPTLTLSPSYCYPEHLKLPFTKKLLALNKSHNQMRSN